MKYIYGPVQSRRLGNSLGVSLTNRKVCSYDCIYCQLGKTTVKTSDRLDYVKIEDILSELKEALQAFNSQGKQCCDYITLSGFGEPTLNINIKELINNIKDLATISVALITNASLFSIEEARRDILGADLIVPSLDAVTQDVFEIIDRPYSGIKIEDVIKGLILLRKEFKGKIYLEIMLIKGINDSLDYAKKFKEAIIKINPDKIQLNVPVRATAEPGLEPPSDERLLQIKEILGTRAEII